MSDAIPSSPVVREPVVVRFEETDLAGILRDGVEPPEQLYEGVVYREGVHWFSGHPASGDGGAQAGSPAGHTAPP